MPSSLRADVEFLLALRNSVKLYHFTTKTYSRHIATDAFVSELDKLSDEYVEVRLAFASSEELSHVTGIPILPLRDSTATDFVMRSIDYVDRRLYVGDDTALATIRDEIGAVLRRLLYLMRIR